MAYLMDLMLPGCEHMDASTAAKVRKVRKAGAGADFIQYTCVECDFKDGFGGLDNHFTETSHGFASSHISTYCAQCKDIIYDPDFVRKNTKQENLVEANQEEDPYLVANTSQRPCGREGVRGLFNLGETCYMNAVIQMMVHNPLLAGFFLGNGHPIHYCPISNQADKKNDSDSEDEDDEAKDPKACDACGMTEVFSDAVQADQSQPAHAVNLLFASWKNIPHMQGKQQQDAQEWFILIVDKLHEAISETPDTRMQCDCFFHNVFFGKLQSEVTCDKCKSVSTTEDEYSSISLDFKKQFRKKKKAQPDVKSVVPNVHECLRSYTAPEILSAEQYKCRKCDAPRTASKQVRIRLLPTILCVHVKRFGGKAAGGTYVQEKYDGKIDFPLVLDMSPYVTPSTQNVRNDSLVYDLDCVVVHQGDHVHNGHYYAFCRIGRRWFRFDDEIVSATTTEDVLRQEAYLLFYSLRHLQ